MKAAAWVIGAAAVSLSCLVAACTGGGAAGGGEGGSLVGTNWLAQTIDGRPAANYPASTLSFPTETTIAGSGGCNNFSGTVGMAGQQIAVGPLATTKKMCPPEVMAQETALLQALAAAKTFQRTPYDLTISDATGTARLTFTLLTQPL